MTSMKSAALALALSAVGFALPAAAQSAVAGPWELTVQAPQGTMIVTMNVSIEGEKATGTLASTMGTLAISGTATPDSLQMSGTLDMQGLSIALGLTGKAADGSFNGSLKLGDLGDAPFTGKRPAAPAAAASAAAPAAAVAGVAGKWNVTLILTGAGEFPVVVNLTQSGQDVSGTLNSMLGDVPLKGTFVGSTLTVNVTITGPQGPMTATLTGELAGQTLAGKASIAGLGEADWKAVRGQ